MSATEATYFNEKFRGYAYSKQEKEAAIRVLCETYPNCFFEEPRLRRPLEHNIISDLEKDGAPLPYDLLTAAVEWYQSRFAYRNNIQPGVKKINLDGKEISTVTESEYLKAQAKIRADKQKVAERNAAAPPNAIETAGALYRAGRIPDDQLKKIDAPPAVKVAAPVKVVPNKVIEPVSEPVKVIEQPVKPMPTKVIEPVVKVSEPVKKPTAVALVDALKQHTRKKHLVAIGVQVEDSLLQRIDSWAAQNDLSRSEVVRAFLDYALTVAEQGQSAA